MPEVAGPVASAPLKKLWDCKPAQRNIVATMSEVIEGRRNSRFLPGKEIAGRRDPSTAIGSRVARTKTSLRKTTARSFAQRNNMLRAEWPATLGSALRFQLREQLLDAVFFFQRSETVIEIVRRDLRFRLAHRL